MKKNLHEAITFLISNIRFAHGHYTAFHYRDKTSSIDNLKKIVEENRYFIQTIQPKINELLAKLNLLLNIDGEKDNQLMTILINTINLLSDKEKCKEYDGYKISGEMNKVINLCQEIVKEKDAEIEKKLYRLIAVS